MITTAQLRELATLIRDHGPALQLLAHITATRIDDWLITLLTRLAANEHLIDQVADWLNWTGILAAPQPEPEGLSPCEPGGLSPRSSHEPGGLSPSEPGGLSPRSSQPTLPAELADLATELHTLKTRLLESELGS